MAGTLGTSLFSAPLKYKSNPNVSIGTAVTLMEYKLKFEHSIAKSFRIGLLTVVRLCSVEWPQL